MYNQKSLMDLKTWRSKYMMCSLVWHATRNDDFYAVSVLVDSAVKSYRKEGAIRGMMWQNLWVGTKLYMAP